MAILFCPLIVRQLEQFPNEVVGSDQRKIGRAGYVAHIEEMRNACIIFLGNVKVTDHFGNIG
jgi:hypothetical protein